MGSFHVYSDGVNTACDLLNIYCWTGKLKSCKNGDLYPAMFDKCPPENWLDHVNFGKVAFSKQDVWS